MIPTITCGCTDPTLLHFSLECRLDAGNFLATMDNNALGAILERLETINQGMESMLTTMTSIRGEMSTMNERLDRIESRQNSRSFTPRLHVSSSGHDQNPSITIFPETLHTKVNTPSSPQNAMSQVTNYPQNREQGMNRVCSPYFDPDFDGLAERINGPKCRVTIDNESLENCTVVKIDSVNKQGLLLEVVQVLTDMNLSILKGYISSDAGWFMDVFHVKDELGNKVTNQRVVNYIQQALGANREGIQKSMTGSRKIFKCQSLPEPRAIEMTGRDRPGLFSEITAALADLHCNIVEAHAWSHNARLACVVYISEESTDTPIDHNRLTAIEDHLTTVLRATTTQNTNEENVKQQEVKTSYGLNPEGEGTVTDVERRLHQLMLSVRDFESPSKPIIVGSPRLIDSSDDHKEEKMLRVYIENCDEKGYSIVAIQCKDRRRLMFDTVCTLADMQYVIFHASVDSRGGYAFQEYFIRHVDGYAMSTESEKQRVIKCLEAAIERRVCEGIRLELCANNRVGLLSDITRVLRENGLAVVRADIATEGGKARNILYLRDISGNNIDMKFLKSMKTEMGEIDVAVNDETTITTTTTTSSMTRGSSFRSLGDLMKSQFEKLSHNFITI
ncbi:ACT domain-containing protein ACR2 [Capsicum baccatum]|uniref:ACT domain-containing protein ACR n=1 Tax=Capsicum baccatum TaxID=33114 RepID=A0A2G2WI84_CAPBA|nr:ACT domain-containing protein ACR2 [Capsicum baccatum]